MAAARRFVAAVAALCMLTGPAPTAHALAAEPGADVVVYGGTPSGVIAAVTAARGGASTILLEPTAHVGGMFANGLVATDIGDKRTIGGYAKEFFDRVAARYAERGIVTRWRFEPHVAEQVFEDMLADAGVTLVRHAELVPADPVGMEGSRVARVTTAAGAFSGGVFIDASYGGDLMAAAGVSYRVGRESTEAYGESLAGVRPARLFHTATVPIPDDFAGVPAPGAPGTADQRVQASNFRLCFSSDSASRVPFTEPAGYDRDRYAIVAEYLQQHSAPALSAVLTLYPTIPDRFDVNSYGVLSTELPGRNWTWPEGTAAERAAVERAHADHARGLVWFLATDPAVPAVVRSALAGYGWCADEWTDNGHFPRQLYIREARRMVADRVVRQQDVSATADGFDAIGIASYRIDSHPVTRWVSGAEVWAEGGMYQAYTNYPIPFGILLPRDAEASNLLVSVAVSATHVAWASLRMEPHFMMMGEAAGEAAAASLANGIPLHGLIVDAVQDALAARGVALPGSACIAGLAASGVVVAGQPTSIALTLRDLLGRGCRGTLRLTTTDAKATLPGDISFKSGDGDPTHVPVTLRTAGPQRLMVRDARTGQVMSSLVVPVQPGPTIGFRFSGLAPRPVAGAATSVTVIPVDAWANATPAYRGTIRFTTTDVAATMPSPTTFDAAAETVRLVFRTSGSQAVRVTDTLRSTITLRAGVTVLPAATATFRFEGLATQPVAGAAFDITVRPYDAYGNQTPAYRGTVRFTSTDSLATLPANTTFDAASEAVRVTLRTSGARSLTAADTASATVKGTASAVVRPGLTAAFRWVLPATMSTGLRFYATVVPIDAWGNQTPSYRGTVRFTTTDRAATLPLDTVFDAAYETVAITFRTAGVQGVRATDRTNVAITGLGRANVVQ